VNDTARWVIGILVAVLIVGLIAYARGTEHHRGLDVGVHASAPSRLAG
jgi:hypothetical protein